MATKKMNPKQKNKRRVMIDFPSQEAAVEWFHSAQDVGVIPEEAALFKPDGLDFLAESVTPGRCLIVRRKTDRADQTRVDNK